jgi:hypothetical protein
MAGFVYIDAVKARQPSINEQYFPQLMPPPDAHKTIATNCEQPREFVGYQV